MKRLMWVPLNSFGKSTNIPMVATVFCTLCALSHLDGKAQSAHTHLVNRQLAVVALALHVVQGFHGGVGFRRARRESVSTDFEHG